MNDKKKRIIFDKTYERDSTLIVQGIWARSLTGNIEKEFRIKSPYHPIIIHYATGENLQIWENRQAVKYLLNQLLKKNLKGEDFINSLIEKYKKFVAELNKFWDRGHIIEKNDLQKYLKLVEKSILYCTLFFYIGMDERTPDKVMKLAIKGREMADFFARNDKFVRNCIIHMNDNLKGLEDLVLLAEFLNLPKRMELLKRAKGIILIDGTDAVSSSLEEFAKKHLNKYKFESFGVVGNDIIEIKGQAAYLGKAKGIVRIVKNRRQIEKVKKGDILVSPMTTPDFISAMKKATAFVTDEGGIVCHASIVAREMKIPCIIGTKIATQVLKDGDLVEVDADKGLVRILK